MPIKQLKFTLNIENIPIIKIQFNNFLNIIYILIYFSYIKYDEFLV